MKLCISCKQEFESRNWGCPHCSYQPQVIGDHVAFAQGLALKSEGFEAEYFPRLATQEASNFWFRSRNRLLIWALHHYFPNVRNFLEVGCGTGFVLSGLQTAFPHLTLSGSEVFSDGLQFAAARLPGVELFQMDARQIPFREEFDVIGAFDVLEHVNEDEEVLLQMYQATRKGGGIIVTVPHHRFLWSPLDEFARHVRRYQAKELREKVSQAGFVVVRVTSYVSLLLPLLIASRFKQRLGNREVDPSAEYNIGNLLNSSLEKILDLERVMIRAGLSFAVGGSLLLVARRT